MANILIVDDDPLIRDLLGDAFREEGYDVREAADGRLALDAVLERVPDLIVLDLAMPEMDGCRFLEELRARGLRETTRVIVVTGTSVEDALPGVRSTFVKPFEIDELIDAVRRALADPPDELYARNARDDELAYLIRSLDLILD